MVERTTPTRDTNPGGTRTIAVFDFDKTLSTRDNVVPFFVAALGRTAVARGLLRSIPDVLCGRRDAIKAHFVRALAGRDEQEVRALAARIADDVIARHLRPDVVARVAWHQRRGDEVVIVSASFSWYLEPVAVHLNIDHVLATDLEVANGRLTGLLVGPNVRRAEKVRRLEAWLDGAPAQIWAYGDNAGDRELLARADVGVLVGRAPLPRSPDDIPLDRSGPDSASGTGRVAP